ncbi:MAG: hypothetical protein ACK56I_08775, partial [bacterium]
LNSEKTEEKAAARRTSDVADAPVEAIADDRLGGVVAGSMGIGLQAHGQPEQGQLVRDRQRVFEAAADRRGRQGGDVRRVPEHAPGHAEGIERQGQPEGPGRGQEHERVQGNRARNARERTGGTRVDTAQGNV